MRKILIAVGALTVFILSGGVASAERMRDGSFQVAQAQVAQAGATVGSCQSAFRTCSARCKERAPKDKSCVSDHCSPKLSECRQTGCWQEGALYGGAKQCGLAK